MKKTATIELDDSLRAVFHAVGWLPGGYFNTCMSCDKQFHAAKHCTRCYECATDRINCMALNIPIQEAKQELWEILVPCQDNDGKPFRTRHHKEWDRQVKKITGGLTIMKPATGYWISPDEVEYKDRMIPVRIIINHEAELDDIIARTMKHYDQLAVMVHKVSDEVKIIHRDDI